jgi:hypothetical protein
MRPYATSGSGISVLEIPSMETGKRLCVAHPSGGVVSLDQPGGRVHNQQMIDDARRFAPSAARNSDAILKALSPQLPKHGRVLEVASGSGEHTMHFAAANPGLTFQPSDFDPDARSRPRVGGESKVALSPA